MAPDLNSVPASPRNLALNSHPTSESVSRRTSQIMPPPALPQQASSHGNATPAQESPALPVRHPRPLTPAELHLELEKEQEGIVNRLTRELSVLRAHSASVTSNSSTSSSAIHDSQDPIAPPTPSNPAFPITGPTHPTPSRRHRSSSSLSTRSHASSFTGSQPHVSQTHLPPHTAPIGSTSQASVDRARDAAGTGPGSNVNLPIRSRQNSTAVPQPHSISAHPSPSPSPSLRNSHAFTGEGSAYFPAPGHAGARHSLQSMGSSVSSLHGGVRVEDAAAARQALEAARGENEMLIRKVKELERELRRTRRARDVRPAGGEESGGVRV